MKKICWKKFISKKNSNYEENPDKEVMGKIQMKNYI